MKRKIYFAVGTVMSVVILAAAFYTGGLWFNQSSNQASGLGQGIKVHGWWTITVKNPDGSVAEKRQFENSLTTDGGVRLANILGRKVTTGNWFVYLKDNSGAGPCSRNNQASLCAFYEKSSLQTASSYIFPNLNVSASNGKLTLSGTGTAQMDGIIAQVNTNLEKCDNTTATAQCTWSDNNITGYSDQFTFKSLSNPISVTAGQQILVTVVISFS